MRAVRMSPKMPHVVMPIASPTAIQPSGISSIAPRVEIGFAQLSGVARSSRAGTNRIVKAGPISRVAIRLQRLGAVEPAAADAFLQQNGRDRGGGHMAENVKRGVMRVLHQSQSGAEPIVTMRPPGLASFRTSSISASSSSKSSAPRFSESRSTFDVRGMTTAPS